MFPRSPRRQRRQMRPVKGWRLPARWPGRDGMRNKVPRHLARHAPSRSPVSRHPGRAFRGMVITRFGHRGRSIGVVNTVALGVHGQPRAPRMRSARSHEAAPVDGAVPTERLSMRSSREIVRQKWLLGRAHRAIAESVGASLGVVSKTLQRASAAGLTWELMQGTDLLRVCSPQRRRRLLEVRPRARARAGYFRILHGTSLLFAVGSARIAPCSRCPATDLRRRSPIGQPGQ